MNTNRLIQVLSWNIIGTKKDIIRQTALIFASFCVILLMLNIKNWIHGIADYYSIESTAHTMIFGAGVAMLVWASRIGFNMKTKTEFINYAMLPATNGEKFTANFIYQTILRIVTLIVGMLAADALQCIISFIVSGDAYSMSLIMMKTLCNSLFNYSTESERMVFELDSLVLLLFIHASYVFGGTFFRKHQLIYTTLFWIFGPMLILGILTGIGVGSVAALHDMGYVVSIDWLLGETASVITLSIIILALTLGLYYLAYRYFCRTQIINNKFIN